MLGLVRTRPIVEDGREIPGVHDKRRPLATPIVRNRQERRLLADGLDIGAAEALGLLRDLVEVDVRRRRDLPAAQTRDGGSLRGVRHRQPHDVIEPAAPQQTAAVPLPRPRPASAPITLENGELAYQPGSLAIALATRKPQPDDGEVLGAAGIERMKLALALTAEQEEYWPAIAAELRALGKLLKSQKGQNVSLDNDAIQRLYWAAAPLISRLSYEQKQKVKQMAHVMGLHQVAQAL